MGVKLTNLAWSIVLLSLVCVDAFAQDETNRLRDSALLALQDGDLPTAAKMLEKLGNEGVSQGYTMLGQIKRELGDYPDAARWFERGAKDGDVTAMLEGGEIISNPVFGINDARRAFRLWLAAAERESSRGQYEAGRALMDGYGTRVDVETGVDFLEKAAKQCHAQAQLDYALALRKGNGRIANGEEAFAWMIAVERSSESWVKDDIERISTLQTEISAYMSSSQIKSAHCLGLGFISEGCGGDGILYQIERWLVCEN